MASNVTRDLRCSIVVHSAPIVQKGGAQMPLCDATHKENSGPIKVCMPSSQNVDFLVAVLRADYLRLVLFAELPDAMTDLADRSDLII